MSLGKVRITADDYPALYRACQISFENEGIDDIDPLFFRLDFTNAELVTDKKVLESVEESLSKVLDNDEKFEELIVGDLWQDGEPTKDEETGQMITPQFDAAILVELFGEQASWMHSALDDLADAIEEAADEALDEEMDDE